MRTKRTGRPTTETDTDAGPGKAFKMTYQRLVFQADLDPAAGHEQAGRRPVLVVSAEPLNAVYGVVSVVPITSRKNNRLPRIGEVLLPAGTAGLLSDSFCLCYQVRALDKTRLGRIYGTLTQSVLQQEIKDMVGLCLDLL